MYIYIYTHREREREREPESAARTQKARDGKSSSGGRHGVGPLQLTGNISTGQRVTCTLQQRGHRNTRFSEGGMIRLETLIELKFQHSSFSSLSSY